EHRRACVAAPRPHAAGRRRPCGHRRGGGGRGRRGAPAPLRARPRGGGGGRDVVAAARAPDPGAAGQHHRPGRGGGRRDARAGRRARVAHRPHRSSGAPLARRPVRPAAP
ncbi:MAG: hypothetical protein AVDCRST_MAG30-878, partial [uncultured Solirubrobacteraceae bacterium]